MFDRGLLHIAKKGLTGTEYSVLLTLIAYSRYENWITIDQQTFANELEITKGQVCKALKKLCTLEVLEIHKDPQDKRRNIYRINPQLGWRGSEDQWRQHRVERSKSKVVDLFQTPK